MTRSTNQSDSAFPPGHQVQAIPRVNSWAGLSIMTHGPGLHNPGVVDVVFVDPATQVWSLTIVESLGWENPKEWCMVLQAKVNTYLAFALDGQMAEMYPQSAGMPTKIELDCYEPLPDQVLKFVERLGHRVREYGLDFNVNVLSE